MDKAKESQLVGTYLVRYRRKRDGRVGQYFTSGGIEAARAFIEERRSGWSWCGLCRCELIEAWEAAG